jgi:hypothetical protein
MDKEDDAYNEEDLAHLMVFDANVGTHVLTIHLEMGLTQRHTQLEYPAGGLSGEVRTMFTGYFMVLMPEGGEEKPEVDHAIEALRVTWGKYIAPEVHALVRNPELGWSKEKLGARPAYTSKKGHRAYRHKLSSGKVDYVPTAPYHTPHTPHTSRTPLPAAAARTVHRVRHKDVAHRLVVPVDETVTRDVVRMLNMHGIARK